MRLAADRVQNHQAIDTASDRDRHANPTTHYDNIAPASVDRRGGDPDRRRFDLSRRLLWIGWHHLHVQARMAAVRNDRRNLDAAGDRCLRMGKRLPASLPHGIEIFAIAAGQQIQARLTQPQLIDQSPMGWQRVECGNQRADDRRVLRRRGLLPT